MALNTFNAARAGDRDMHSCSTGCFIYQVRYLNESATACNNIGESLHNKLICKQDYLDTTYYYIIERLYFLLQQVFDCL